MVQVIDVHRQFQRTKVTLLVMRFFFGYLGASSTNYGWMGWGCTFYSRTINFDGIWVY